MNGKKFKKTGKREAFLVLSIIVLLICSAILIFIDDKMQITARAESNAKVDTQSLMTVSYEVSDITKLLNVDSKSTMVQLPAYILRVDGEDVGIFRTEEEVNSLLDTISKPFLSESSVARSIEYKEEVYVVKTLIPMKEFNNRESYDNVLYSITKGTTEKKIHKVDKGENYWTIAKKYNIKPNDLIKANPDVVPERLQIGQEISLVVPKPLITTITSEIVEYIEYIDFNTEYEESKSLYKGEYRLKIAGQKGEKKVKAKVSKENGIEVNKNVMTESKIKNPVTKVVIKGIKEPPPKIGTGVLSKPTSRGYITSPFGMRWGRPHNGIDIGMPIGTDIKAADGGRVIYSGYKGGYGYCVIVDHGANVRTLYAHNSKLLVKKGEKVFKGQTIAKSGNSGRSTGPHLHFEVLKNGKPVNPSNYVKY